MIEDLQQQLAARLGGQLPAFEQWRSSFAAAPRDRFIPDRAWWLPNGEPMTVIDRAADPEGWLAAVYSDVPIVTQLDGAGTPTSSCSMPYMVFAMLAALYVRAGQRVLEIGTGTGWNAALLADNLGDDHVFSIEVDPQVAGDAKANLAAVGCAPMLLVGDGGAGWPDAAPFDRIIATCAVNRVPYAWVEQTTPDGVIVTPWDSGIGLGGLLRLAVDDGGRAAGRFVETASFMWLRAQTPQQPDEPDDFDSLAAATSVTVDLPTVRTSLARFVVGLLVPDAVSYGFSNGPVIWLLADGSWASIDTTDGTVRQLGVRRLWDEVEAANRWWARAGSPDLERFGITVTAGDQRVWLDEPGNIISRS